MSLAVSDYQYVPYRNIKSLGFNNNPYTYFKLYSLIFLYLYWLLVWIIYKKYDKKVQFKTLPVGLRNAS